MDRAKLEQLLSIVDDCTQQIDDGMNVEFNTSAALQALAKAVRELASED